MKSPPPEVIASWPQPNYENPQTRGRPELLIVGGIFILLSMIAFSLRLYTRLRISKNFGADDIVLIVGVICSLVLTSFALHCNFSGFWNRHIWDVPFTTISQAMKYTMVAHISYQITATCIKLSFVLFYLRILDHRIWRHYRIVLFGIMSLVIIMPCVYIPLIIFQCRPIRAYWEILEDHEFYCLPLFIPNISNSIVSNVLDLILVLLPIPKVLRLRVPLRQRIIISCLFAAGLSTCVAGCFRAYWLWFIMFNTWDPTWYGNNVNIATQVEINLAITCLSILTLCPLARKYCPRRVDLCGEPSPALNFEFVPGQLAAPVEKTTSSQSSSFTTEPEFITSAV